MEMEFRMSRTMANCQFSPNGDHWICLNCEHPLKGIDPQRVKRRCVPVRPAPFKPLRDTGENRFITEYELVRDSRELANRLPQDVGRVVGVARSGITPASIVAKHLHVPIDIVDQQTGKVVETGCGFRGLHGSPRGSAVAMIDDTVMTGHSLLQVTQAVTRHYSTKVITAAVYCNPSAHRKPDVFAVSLPWPHLLEWNLFNSVLIQGSAFDMDGILCEDCPPECDDDGDRYAEWMQNVRPLYPVRIEPIPLIVTARLEKWRPLTEAWLKKWGIRWKRLVMGPWSSLTERNRPLEVSSFKAEHFRQFLRTARGLEPHLFVESCPIQAREIATLSGGKTLCPAAGRTF